MFVLVAWSLFVEVLRHVCVYVHARMYVHMCVRTQRRF